MFSHSTWNTESLFHHVFRHFGFPRDIVSVRGPQLSEIPSFSCWGFLLSAYKPDTIPKPTPRLNVISRKSGDPCGLAASNTSTTGVVFLPWAEYAQNSLRQTTTGLIPFQCILGYQPPLVTTEDKRSGSQSGTSVFICPVESWVPATYIPSPSKGRSLKSLTSWPYLLSIAFHLHFISLSSNPSLNLCH